MSELACTLQHLPVMTYKQMLEVRYEGAYPTREQAGEAVHLVLAGLGRRLTGDERVELAARLPLEAARVLTAQIPDIQPLTGWAFVRTLATHPAAPWVLRAGDASAPSCAPSQPYAGPDLLTPYPAPAPLATQLLFGRAELAPDRLGAASTGTGPPRSCRLRSAIHGGARNLMSLPGPPPRMRPRRVPL